MYLCSRLDEMLEKARAGLSSLAAERDRIEKTDPPSIMRDATLKVLEERIQRQIGYCNGLSDVWQLLHQRFVSIRKLNHQSLRMGIMRVVFRHQREGSVVSVFSFGRDAGKSARRTVQSRR